MQGAYVTDPCVEEREMEETATVSTEEDGDGDATSARTNSLFPLLAQTSSSHQNSSRGGDSQWLTNCSFTADLSAIDATLSSSYHHKTTELEQDSESNDDEEEVERSAEQRRQRELHKLVKSSSTSSGEEREDKKRGREKKRKNKKRKISSEEHYGAARKSTVSSWAAPDAKATATKDYYFDSRGDRDNLAFGCLYRCKLQLALIIHASDILSG